MYLVIESNCGCKRVCGRFLTQEVAQSYINQRVKTYCAQGTGMAEYKRCQAVHESPRSREAYLIATHRMKVIENELANSCFEIREE